MVKFNDFMVKQAYYPGLLGRILCLKYQRKIIDKILLVIAFLSLLLVNVCAYKNSLGCYYLSIYDGLPATYIPTIIICYFISLLIVFFDSKYTILGFLLALLTITSVISLPLIQGYYSLGYGDPLTHIGATMEIGLQTSGVNQHFYPGIYLICAALGDILGISVNHASSLVVIFFVIVYLTFVFLLGRLVCKDRFYLKVLFYSGLLLLPINNISNKLMYYPTLQAISYVPLLLFIHLQFSCNTKFQYSLLGIISGLFCVLLHPLIAFVYVISMICSLCISYFFDRSLKNTILCNIGSLAFLGLFAPIWILCNTRTFGLLSIQFRVFKAVVLESDSLDELYQVTDSLGSVSANVNELALKMFLLPVIFIGLSSLTYYFLVKKKMPYNVFEFIRLRSLMCVPLVMVVLVLLYTAGGKMRFSFRFYGYAMIFITIIACIGYYIIANRSASRNIYSVVFLLVGFMLTISCIYPSPYIYQESGIVPNSTVHGMSTFIAYKSHDVDISSLYIRPYRLSDVVVGPSASDNLGVRFLTSTDNRRSKYVISPHFANRQLLDQWASNPQINGALYLMITEADRSICTVRDYYQFDMGDFIWFENNNRVFKILDNPSSEYYICLIG